MSGVARFHSWIGSSTPDSITVGGLDLPSEVMGRLSLTDLAYLLVTHREPTSSERRMLDTVLVALAEVAVEARQAAGLRVPGLGHPVHRDIDPRTRAIRSG